MGKIDARLNELGIDLPDSNPPSANYVPYVKTGNLVFISGQTAKWNGVLQYKGKAGETFSLEEAQQAARLCAFNVLLQLKTACDGDLDKVKRCVKLTVFVHAADDFTDHAKVANGASDVMVEVFGDAGRHARSAVGHSSLPNGTTAEVEAVFEVDV